jgi:hypothetical protein
MIENAPQPEPTVPGQPELKPVLSITEIRTFEDNMGRTIRTVTPIEGGAVAYVGKGQIVAAKADGTTQKLADFQFRIEAGSIEDAFAKHDAAQKVAAGKVVEEMRKPRIALPGNGPAYKPPRRF